jgi:hypothetical protein
MRWPTSFGRTGDVAMCYLLFAAYWMALTMC